MLPSYSFNTDAPLFGSSATVSFTVSNGNTTSANQTYTFGQVSQIGIATNGSLNVTLSSLGVLAGGIGAAVTNLIFSTGAAGVATTDFGLNGPTSYEFNPVNHLGPTVHLSFNSNSFRLIENGFDPVGSTHQAGVSNATTLLSLAVTPDGLPPSNIPEPDSLALDGAGALAFVLSRRRVARKATAE